MLKQALHRQIARQHAREECAMRAHQVRLARRREARNGHAQTRRAEHPNEPYEEEHEQRQMQPWVGVEFLGIIRRSQALMIIVKDHDACAPEARAGDIGQQPRIIGTAEGAVREERAQGAHHDAPLPKGACPHERLGALLLMRQRQEIAIVGYARRPQPRRGRRDGKRPLHEREVRVAAIGNQCHGGLGRARAPFARVEIYSRQ